MSTRRFDVFAVLFGGVHPRISILSSAIIGCPASAEPIRRFSVSSSRGATAVTGPSDREAVRFGHLM